MAVKKGKTSLRQKVSKPIKKVSKPIKKETKFASRQKSIPIKKEKRLPEPEKIKPISQEKRSAPVVLQKPPRIQTAEGWRRSQLKRMNPLKSAGKR